MGAGERVLLLRMEPLRPPGLLLRPQRRHHLLKAVDPESTLPRVREAQVHPGATGKPLLLLLAVLLHLQPAPPLKMALLTALLTTASSLSRSRLEVPTSRLVPVAVRAGGRDKRG